MYLSDMTTNLYDILIPIKKETFYIRYLNSPVEARNTAYDFLSSSIFTAFPNPARCREQVFQQFLQQHVLILR